MQFASISQGSLYPQAELPKLVAICTLGKLCKFRRPFSDLDHGKWNSQNLQQIVQNLITAAQLHKSVTGIDYKSGPHAYKKKCKTTDTVSTTSKIKKTAPGPSLVPQDTP